MAVPQNVKYGVTIGSTYFTPKNLSKKNENICPHKTCTQMFTTALFIIDEMKEKTKWPFNGWVNKYGQVTLEYYSPKKLKKGSTATCYDVNEA